MRKRRFSLGDGGLSDRVAADIFAGFLVSMVLILAVVFLQTIEIQKLRRVKDIFDKALADIGTASDQIQVSEGRITVKAEALFASGNWVLDEQQTALAFGGVRTALVEGVNKLDEQLRRVSSNGDTTEYVEIRVVGHADCQTLNDMYLTDNLDLSGLRANSLVRFLTQPCDGLSEWSDQPQYECCEDGTLDCPDSERTSKRLDPYTWTVMPVARSSWEPRAVPAVLSDDLPGGCGDWDEEQLKEQRRVVIEVVPRLDRLLGVL